ncbi:MAG: hypothetical protein KatS3mg061_0150 [Dehalococcoidia bacterium]|nr:MAG: hypothetical protein KatS3mg061_0150 [Dehalococcoidia bacterium]
MVGGYARGRLEQLLSQPGCPVCRALAENTALRQRWFLQEYYGEGPWIGRLRESVGFCTSHFWGLSRSGASYQLTYVLQYLLDGYRSRLCEARQLLTLRNPRAYWRSRLLLARVRAALLPRQSCPLCADTAAWEQGLLTDLLALLAEPAFATRYQQSDGLCVRHVMAAAHLAPAAVLAFLIADLDCRLERLRAETVEYFRKAEWTHRHEPKGAEQTAWLRGIARLVGPDPCLASGSGPSRGR